MFACPRAADAAFVLALIETAMRVHAERTWGRFDADRDAFAAALGAPDHGIVAAGATAAGYLAVDHRFGAA